MKLDDVDFQILKILNRNARASIKHIADKVGLSSPSVSARLKKLRKVFTPTILFEFEEVGLDRHFIALTLRTGIPTDSKKKIVDKIKSEPAVYAIWETTGKQDLMVHVLFATAEELVGFIDNKLRPMSEISSIEVSQIVRPYRDIWVTYDSYYEVMKKYGLTREQPTSKDTS